jgi:hypothetical protein
MFYARSGGAAAVPPYAVGNAANKIMWEMEQRRHKDAMIELSKCAPAIDQKEPASYVDMSLHRGRYRSRAQVEQLRHQHVGQENRKLMGALHEIAKTPCMTLQSIKSEPGILPPLQGMDHNKAAARQRRQQGIEKENERIAKRLMKIQTTFNRRKDEREYTRHRRAVETMARVVPPGGELLRRRKVVKLPPLAAAASDESGTFIPAESSKAARHRPLLHSQSSPCLPAREKPWSPPLPAKRRSAQLQDKTSPGTEDNAKQSSGAKGVVAASKGAGPAVEAVEKTGDATSGDNAWRELIETTLQGQGASDSTKCSTPMHGATAEVADKAVEDGKDSRNAAAARLGQAIASSEIDELRLAVGQAREVHVQEELIEAGEVRLVQLLAEAARHEVDGFARAATTDTPAVLPQGAAIMLDDGSAVPAERAISKMSVDFHCSTSSWLSAPRVHSPEARISHLCQTFSGVSDEVAHELVQAIAEFQKPQVEIDAPAIASSTLHTNFSVHTLQSSFDCDISFNNDSVCEDALADDVAAAALALNTTQWSINAEETSTM